MIGTRRAFTLLELLVVIALISLLVVFTLVSLKAVRASASRADSLGALRQMGMAYSSYTADHRHQLMPGYIDAGLLTNGLFSNLTVVAPDGTELVPADAQSYVWRLAPYVDGAWQTFFSDLNDAGVMSACEADYGQGHYGPGSSPSFPGGISERPAFGMNSIFVGGDSAHGGSASNHHPWQSNNPVIAATRMSQVKNPTRLIVFGPAALATTSGDVYQQLSPGFCELRAPFLFHPAFDSNPQEIGDAPWTDQQWCIGDRSDFPVSVHGDFVSPGGMPIMRAGGRTMPVAHLDGSTAQLRLLGDIWVDTGNKIVADMSRWYPFQVGARDTDTTECP